jgi:hypothetical protein
MAHESVDSCEPKSGVGREGTNCQVFLITRFLTEGLMEIQEIRK